MLANRRRIIEKMEQFELDILIATYPENVCYLSNYQSHKPYLWRFFDTYSYAIFPRRDDIAPALIIPVKDVTWEARFPSWFKEVYTFGNPSYILSSGEILGKEENKFKKILDDKNKNAKSAGECIVKVLKKMGIKNARIGLDEKNIQGAIREKIITDLPNINLIDAFELFRLIRMVKTPEEIERLKIVGLKNERAITSVLNKVSKNISEDEITQYYLENIAKEGAIFDFWNSSAGRNSSMGIMSSGHFSPYSEYKLKKGDIFRFDGGCIYNKYHADFGGCAVLGTPNKKQKKCYKAIESGMERAKELLQPGVIPSKIFQETVTAVEKAGLKDYSRITTNCGHGIGIELRDYPFIRKPVKADSPFLPGSYDVPIEENMVINIEVPYKELGLGGFQIEYTFLVGKDGCKKLYPHERDMYTL